MPEIQILSGRAGAGKTRRVLACLKEHMEQGTPAFLLVPEQSTYEAERALAELAGGIAGVEVYGFSRLCERILQAAGQEKPYLSAQGRVIVAKRAIEKLAPKLTLFARAARTAGFAGHVDNLCCSLKKSDIRPKQLAEALEKLDPGSQLYQKLSDIHLLYAESEDFLATRYLTDDDMPAAVLELLPTSFLAGAYVYVDGIDNPSRQMFSLLSAITACAARTAFTLRMDDSPLSAAPTSPLGEGGSLFAPDRRIYDRLQEMAALQGIPFSEIRLTETAPPATPALVFLERHLFAAGAPVFDGDAKAVTITAASNPHEEVETLADAVLSLARTGVRYRDMAVIAGDLATYAPLISRAFALRDIPLFYDSKRPILGHPAAELMLAAVRSVAGGYRAADLLRVAKSGYSGCAREDVEVFENYLLRYGVSGSEMKAPFTFGEVPEAAERVRAILSEPLLALHEGLRRSTNAQKAEAVYAYLAKLNLAEQLKEQSQALLATGNRQPAQVCAQVWNALLALLSQLHAILGETPSSMREFAAVLEEGVRGYQAGVLPGMADQVLLGDMRRTRVGKLHALFVVGCQEGVLPPAHSDDALLSDRELARMEESGLTVWDNSKSLVQSDKLALYTALFKAQYRLCFSYSFASGEETLSPSPLLYRVRKLLPGLTERTALGEEETWPACERRAFHALATAWGARGTPRLHALLAYFKEHPAYRERLRRIMDGQELKLSPPPFDAEVTQTIYGALRRVSPSRLESFARCPYAHFMRYGLGARERPEAAEKEADEGLFQHAALDAFVRRAAAEGKDLRAISDEEAETLLLRVAEELTATHLGGLLLRDVRLKESLFLRMESLAQSVFSLLAQLRAGTFAQIATEQEFGSAEGLPPVILDLADGRQLALYGKIDRVDSCQLSVVGCQTTHAGLEAGADQDDPGSGIRNLESAPAPQALVRVVDYKRSGRKFDPAGIADGTALQLPLYLAAAGGQAAGMYYMSLKQEFPEDVGANCVRPSMLLEGVTGSEEETILASDSNFSDKSEIIAGLKKNKSGQVKGTLATAEEIIKITHAARRVATRLAEGILRGEATVSPLEKSCQYCIYGSVCRFDPRLPGCRTRKQRKVSLEELCEVACDAMDD